MDESTGLENRRAARRRGFESLPFRHQLDYERHGIITPVLPRRPAAGQVVACANPVGATRKTGAPQGAGGSNPSPSATNLIMNGTGL